ncbi:MAG TPA: response regulator [Candidatus Thermoplasmatota archaeon]|nr:response regulator [Candidatus Thermoplasmatota archaeon]
MPASALLLTLRTDARRRPARLLVVWAPPTEEPGRPRQMGGAGGGAPPSDVCILIVDDDPLMTEFLPRKLARAMADGVRIVTAATAREASDILARERPAIVLSDFNLREGRTGLDVLAEAAREAPDATRILFSGHTQREIGIPLREADIHGYIEKPMRIDELVTTLLHTIKDATGMDLARKGAGDGKA